jgi:hypothetical protein
MIEFGVFFIQVNETKNIQNFRGMKKKLTKCMFRQTLKK